MRAETADFPVARQENVSPNTRRVVRMVSCGRPVRERPELPRMRRKQRVNGTMDSMAGGTAATKRWAGFGSRPVWPLAAVALVAN